MEILEDMCIPCETCSADASFLVNVAGKLICAKCALEMTKEKL